VLAGDPDVHRAIFPRTIGHITAPLPRLFAPASRRRTLWLLAIATIALGIAALPSVGTMEDHGVGIIELEFTGTSAKAEQHYEDLGPDGRSAARTSLLLDYPYLVAYGLFLAGACGAVADRARRGGRIRLAALGAPLAWGALGAAACDAIENAMLLLILGGHTGQPWPALAFGLATVKFALVAGALLYAIGGWLASARRPG
jgi:hypothetical protein